MTTYTGIIASDAEWENGSRLSSEALAQIAHHCTWIPVWRTSPDAIIGRVIWGVALGGNVQAVIEGAEDMDMAGLFAIPLFMADPKEQVLNDDGSVREYRNIRLVSVRLTRRSPDPCLTPLIVASSEPKDH